VFANIQFRIFWPPSSSQILKVNIYKTIILPFVFYGCETWSLTLREEHRLRGLRLFENKVLRRIFGPKREEVAEVFVMSSFITCMNHDVLLGLSNR